MNRVAVLLTLVAITTGLRGQAPIERRAPAVAALPAAPLPQPFTQWPVAAAARRGTTLLVESTDSVFPHICKLDHINPDDIICQGGRAPGDIAYERVYIEAIQVAPHSYAALSGIKQTSLYAGLTGVVLGGACNVDGGGVCKPPVYAGLGLLATGLVLHVVQYHLKRKRPQMLYEATGPVARPLPRIFGVPIEIAP